MDPGQLNAESDGKGSDQYPEQEAQRRFEASLRAALNTPPKPHKSMAQNGSLAQRKKRNKKARASS
jgi:hypothetical protein